MPRVGGRAWLARMAAQECLHLPCRMAHLFEPNPTHTYTYTYPTWAPRAWASSSLAAPGHVPSPPNSSIPPHPPKPFHTHSAPSSAGPQGMGFFFTWMRLSTMRQLDWCAQGRAGAVQGWGGRHSRSAARCATSNRSSLDTSACFPDKNAPLIVHSFPGRYRNSNYQSKDIAHVQKHLAERMAFKVGWRGCWEE